MKEQVYLLEQFDDIKILRYDVPAFEGLSLREKLFVYYLSRAALAGRDILWDQNNKYNLRVREALESILRAYQGNRETEEFQAFLVYAKKVFFANGVHHHYSMEKFTPSFTPEYFKSLLREVGAEQLYEEVERVIFDPEYMAKRVVLDEFAYSDEEKELVRTYGYIGGNVHTDLHECLGHGSGKMLPGVGQEALKNYYSTIEEARADLFALYYVMDPKLVELGVIPSLEVAKSEYCNYIRNGLMVQLTRVKLGNNLEESHMRNRQLIASWVYEKGKAANVIERVSRDGKTYFTIRDYEALRKLFGRLLAEVQRVKSEGDFEGARNLIENYGVRIDPVLHQEVLERYQKLSVAPYAGFVNPKYRLVEEEGKVMDVKIEYPTDFLTQMLEYGDNK